MLEQFKINLKTNLDLNKNHKILLAVSGGVDSVVMLDLFAKSGFRCGVAHCNFHLRGDDSDKDEKLVEELADQYQFTFYKKDFQTKEYSKEHGISIEMAARDLRYAWFEEIRNEFGYKYISVAHHQDDIIETFFINLTRGTGIRGLSGIKEKNGFIIRPLLFLNRNQILNYASKNNLSHREDASNDDINIIRNKFRHQILPLLNEVNSAASDNILKTIKNLQSAETIMFQKLDEVKNKLGISKSEPVKLNIEQLKLLNPRTDYFYEILKPFNFNFSQVKDIISSLDSESGKSFYSTTHLLIKDRTDLIVSSHRHKGNLPLTINISDTEINLPEQGSLILEKLIRVAKFEIPKEANTAVIDYNKLKFPLLIREWEQGDYFYPLGMDKKKKVSDFFIDQKLSLIEKQSSLLLISDNQVVWIVGKRLDNRFKITNNTKNILSIKLT